MDLTTMIVVVVSIVLVFSLVITMVALKHEQKRLEILRGRKDSSEDVARLQQELAATQADMAKLRNRVQVLERLAIDSDRSLAGEIERLRNEERI
jgi:hypothetical protein